MYWHRHINLVTLPARELSFFAFFTCSDDQDVADGRSRSVVVFRVFDVQRRAFQREEGLGDVGGIRNVAAHLLREQRDHAGGGAVGAEHNDELRHHAEVDDAVLRAVAEVAAGDELHRAVRHGLERGVDLLVVGVEVVQHDAVGLRPLVEQLAIFYIYSILNPASTSSAV